MALPISEPATLPVVKLYLGIEDERDDDRLARIVSAVDSFVRDLPIAARADGATEWPARIVEGSTMLAGRLWRRKDSPAGIAAVNDLGPVYVQRNDPDVALLLELGDHSKPAVG